MSLEKVKIGGYIAFDDYNDYWPQTMAGVDKFVKEAGSRIKVAGNLRYGIGQIIFKRIA
jgi:hypothetical protein